MALVFILLNTSVALLCSLHKGEGPSVICIVNSINVSILRCSK